MNKGTDILQGIELDCYLDCKMTRGCEVKGNLKKVPVLFRISQCYTGTKIHRAERKTTKKRRKIR